MGGEPAVDPRISRKRSTPAAPNADSAAVGVAHLSHSQAQTILECTGKWHLHYQLGLRAKVEYEALRVGKVVHAALADYFRKPPEGRTEQGLLGDFADYWKMALRGAVALNGGDWLVENDESLGRQYARGQAMLQHLWRRYQNSPSVPACKVEDRLEVDIGAVRFVSVPDAYWVDSAVHIVSIKTSSARPNMAGHLVFSPQHIREALALTLKSPSDKQVLVHYVFLWPGGADMRTIPVTRPQIDDAFADLDNIRRRQEALRSWRENITWNLRPSCERFCEYAPVCMARVQKMDEEAVIEKEFVRADDTEAQGGDADDPEA